MMATLTVPVTTSPFGTPSRKRKVKNQIAATLIGACFLIALVPLVWLLLTVITKGWHVLQAASWWTDDQRSTSQYTVPGGGIAHALIGTLEQVAICTVIAVPVAVLTAVYLVEYGRGRFRSIVTFMVDILTGVPSIVAALFIYAVFIIGFGADFAGIWVSLALVLLMIPVVVRTTEEMLKLVPNELREASYALGVPKWKTILKVVLPTAFSGILTGIMLGIARVAGETAPLLILAQYGANTNLNPLSGNQAALPTMIFHEFPNAGNTSGGKTNPFTGAKESITNYATGRMWGTALTLILLVLVLNIVARLIARRSKVSN
ncbi:MAG: phosphate ABC transporter permease PstA [Jatrophihabitans sp.]|uniref:phosphate ABC transporter permease PstA n=1 Tax=Jatrophihabitans sp. TaxID=1932789 RepID=UPI003F7F7828